MYLRAFVLLVALTLPANAQQPDPVFLQRAIAAVQAQRNVAMDAAAVAEAKVAALTDDLAKAKARIKELEPKGEENK